MVTDYNSMLEIIVPFVSHRLGVDKSNLTEQTLIEDGVGIAGLDTLTFYEEFFREFGISNPDDFNASQYVTSENLEAGLFIKSFFSTKARQELKAKTVYIRHLTNVALTGKWCEQ